MKLRSKFLIWFLVASLVPLALSGVYFQYSLYELGGHFAVESRDSLTDNLHHQLQSYVDINNRQLEEKIQILEWLVRQQAQIASMGPDNGHVVKSESVLSYYREFESLAENLGVEQHILLSPDDQFRYSGVDNNFTKKAPDTYLWQKALDAIEKPVWIFARGTHVDDPSFFLAQSFIDKKTGSEGVVTLQVPASFPFSGLDIPATWKPGVSFFLLSNKFLSDVNGFRVLKKFHFEPDSSGLQAALSEDVLSIDKEESFSSIQKDIEADQSHARMIQMKGALVHWASGVSIADDVFPVIIIPHGHVVSDALDIESHILEKTSTINLLIGSLMLFVSVIISFFAFIKAKTITAPIRALVNVANSFAAGRFFSTADVGGSEEIEELGNAFNSIGPKLHEREKMLNSLNVAREVQKHLLPEKVPEIDGMDVFGQSISAEQIGGDYFDFIESDSGDKGAWAFAVGDVSGHGVPSSLLMASARAVLKTHFWCHDDHLKDIFSLLNNHVARDGSDERFMTLFLGVINNEQKSLYWNSAGHGPVFYLNRDAFEPEELNTTGPPLGVVPGNSFKPEGPLQLNSGDILLIGTDGLWESTNSAGEMFGMKRVRDLLVKYREESAETICKVYFTEIDQFRDGALQEDDATLVVVKIIGDESLGE